MNWRGVTLDERSGAMMDEVVRLCPGVSIQPSQGSWSGASASAGTHTGAGAIDIEAASLTQSHRDKIVYEMRRVGWAAWHRTPQQGQWGHHIHGVAMGEPQLAPAAKDQCLDYVEGRNGLANNAPDDGPRDFVGVTWETYQGSGKEPTTQEDEMFIAEAPGRGAALMAPGYYHSLNEEERDVLRDFGVRLVQHNDRGFDVAQAAMMHGTQDVD